VKKIVFVLLITAWCISCSPNRNVNLHAVLPDLNNKPDGTYRGEYDLKGTPLKVILEIAVKDHAITAITILKHSCSPIGKKGEKITETVIQKQSLDVDVVSGATGSSTAILKAIENALH
jgi:uncharacterized protein with FMN-binding domain